MDTIFYLINVSACIAVFYLTYFSVFRNIAAFKLNRAFLIGGLVCSFIFPTLSISFISPDYHLSAENILPEASANESGLHYVSNTTPPEFNSILLWSSLYVVGVILCVSRVLYDIARVLSLKRRSKTYKVEGISIVQSDIARPFSFFNLVFLPAGRIDQVIFKHEKAHVLKYHWLDLLLAELATAVLWFNPIVHLYKRSIKIQHEYEADAAVLTEGIHVENYLDCLLQHLMVKDASGLISSFYSQNIKQRILMMTRKKTTRNFRLLYLLFLPVSIGLMASFSSGPVKPDMIIHSLDPIDPNDIVIVVDPGHGGQDAGGHANETSEKDVALSIAKDIKKVGEKMGIKVILTRTGDQGVSLEDRLSIANRIKADLFLSIHLNYDPENASNSGIDILVSDKNKEFEKSNRIAEQLQNALSLLGTLKVNPIKNSDFYVLSRSAIPATILELGFLSNKSDHAYITSSKNQQLVSESIINAVVATVK